MTKETLSIVISAKNCEDRIEGTIIPWKRLANEVIVVDQMSSDRTAELAQKLECVVIKNEPPNGNFDLNRKLGMQKAKSDWVLYIDTDERPTADLLWEVEKFLETSKEKQIIEGVKIPNLFYFLGRPLRHGIYNPKSAEIRMVRREKWKYPCEEGYHRSVSVSGKVIRFKNFYKHFNVNSLGEWFVKTNQYTEHDAVKFYQARPSKKSFAFLKAISFFIKHYFFKLGFLDGLHGLVATYYFMNYHLTLELKLWEMQYKNTKIKGEDYLESIKPQER